MNAATLRQSLDAVAECAAALRTLIFAHGGDAELNAHLDAANRGLVGFTCALIVGGPRPGPVTQCDAPGTAAAKPGRPRAARTPAAPKKPAKPAKPPKARKSPPPVAAAAGNRTEDPDRPRRSMGVCVICGQQYLRGGLAQKTCSAECLRKKRAGLDKDGVPLAEEGNP